MFHNFKLLGTEANLDFFIQFDPGKRLYCLFGKNGVGKTTLLRMLTRTMLVRHTILQDKAEDIPYSGLFLTAKLYNELKDRNIRLPQQIEINNKIVKDRNSQNWVISQIEKLKPWVDRLRFIDNDSTLSINQPVVMVATNRRGHTAKLEQSKMRFIGSDDKEFIRIFNHTWNAATEDSIEIEDVSAWIASRLLINPAFAINASSKAQEVVALCKLLAKLDPETFGSWIVQTEQQIQLDVAFNNGEVWIGKIPIDKLATGYVAVVKILQEIIAALSSWAGGNSAEEILAHKGIILIDELEAHLHPRWQVAIVKLLKNSFPNATFVVGTHSPLIVAQTEDGEAYELIRDGNSVTSRRLGNPRDWYLADVYANAFHITLTSPGTIADARESSLIDLFLEFSTEVKKFVGEKNESVRANALALYERIDSRILSDDPRRRSLDSLRSMLG